MSLAVLSAVATLVTVSSISMVESMRERTALRELVNGVEMYRYVALTRDKQITIGSDPIANASELNVVEGWSMSATPQVEFSRHGTCTPGALKFVAPSGRVFDYILASQTCELQAIER
ncbi:MAG: hypothetical protein Hens2KO_22130 [Henriciella sp.]